MELMSENKGAEYVTVHLKKIGFEDDPEESVVEARRTQKRVQETLNLRFSVLEILFYGGQLTEDELESVCSAMRGADLDMELSSPPDLQYEKLKRSHFLENALEDGFITSEEKQTVMNIRQELSENSLEVPEGVVAFRLGLIEEDTLQQLDERRTTSTDEDRAGDFGGPMIQSTVFTMNRMLGIDSEVDLQDQQDHSEEPVEDDEKSSSKHRDQLQERSDLGEKYVLFGELGEGRMGRVLEAKDVDIRRDVAVKILQEDQEGDPERIERFMEEAQVQGQLEHPSIPPVYEIGAGRDARVFFSMQKIQGDSLREILDELEKGREEYRLTRLLQILVKICDGLAYAHSRGVIHRDIKPENIMVGNYGEVHIMDWGLAKIVGYEEPHKEDELVVSDQREDGMLVSRSGSVIGTPA